MPPSPAGAALSRLAGPSGSEWDPRSGRRGKGLASSLTPRPGPVACGAASHPLFCCALLFFGPVPCDAAFTCSCVVVSAGREVPPESQGFLGLALRSFDHRLMGYFCDQVHVHVRTHARVGICPSSAIEQMHTSVQACPRAGARL